MDINTLLTHIELLFNRKIHIDYLLVLMGKIKQHDFYNNWSGHLINDLQKIFNAATNNHVQQIIWLAGDSSLDNKHWIKDKEDGLKPAIGYIYENILEPPQMVQDVSYHLNALLANESANRICINTAIEATTLGQRDTTLLNQDQFIRDRISDNDRLIVSIGGNDIAFGSAGLLHIQEFFKTGKFDFFIELFHNKLKNYIERLIEKKKPKKVIICVIYYPNLNDTSGWASEFLQSLKNINPTANINTIKTMLGILLNKVHDDAISQIKISGTEIIPCKLYEVLDGSDNNDYVSAVEPSIQGGKKMAQKLYELVS